MICFSIGCSAAFLRRFIDIFHNDFCNFPKFTLSWVYQATFKVDIKVFLMVFQHYIGCFFGHTFNSVCYFKFLSDMCCFQIDTVTNVVVRLFICFCNVIWQKFFILSFFHFINVSCFIHKTNTFFDDWIDVISFLSLFWKSLFTLLNCTFEIFFWRSSSNSIKSLCWSRHLHVSKP